MKIIIIGGNSTIGSIVSSHFGTAHEVIVAGRTGGDVSVDISNSNSIKQLFEEVGKVDAIICIAGEAKWANFNDLKSKLMGQVNLVRIGQHYLNPMGSITLSTGILADDPVIKTASAAMVVLCRQRR